MSKLEEGLKRFGFDDEAITKLKAEDADVDSIVNPLKESYEQRIKSVLSPTISAEMGKHNFKKVEAKILETFSEFGLKKEDLEGMDEKGRYEAALVKVRDYAKDQIKAAAASPEIAILQETLKKTMEENKNLLSNFAKVTEEKETAIHNYRKTSLLDGETLRIVSSLISDDLVDIKNPEVLNSIAKQRLLDKGITLDTDDFKNIVVKKDGVPVQDKHSSKFLSPLDIIKSVLDDDGILKKSKGSAGVDKTSDPLKRKMPKELQKTLHPSEWGKYEFV